MNLMGAVKLHLEKVQDLLSGLVRSGGARPSVENTWYAEELKDGLQSIQASAEGLIKSRTEQCAELLELTSAEIRLMGGEFTAQEMRSVQAILKNRAHAIRALAEGGEKLMGSDRMRLQKLVARQAEGAN